MHRRGLVVQKVPDVGVVAGPGLVADAEAVFGAQGVDQGAQRGGQSGVGGGEVRPGGVAAVGGTVSARRTVAAGGSTRAPWSQCQPRSSVWRRRRSHSSCSIPKRPPSSSRSAVVSISGKPAGEALPRRGRTTGSPKRRANATCPAWSRRWSRKNTTFQRSTADRTAATCAASRPAARSTPRISAPMCPATGSTSIPVVPSVAVSLALSLALSVVMRRSWQTLRRAVRLITGRCLGEAGRAAHRRAQSRKVPP